MTVDRARLTLPAEEPVSGFLDVHGLKLRYVDWGNKKADPVILVHGNRDHCRSWDWVAADLRNGWHVMALDFRGHGGSSWAAGGAYAFADFLLDLSVFIERVVDQPVTIVAHSLGGAVSLAYAGLFPEYVSRLVSIEGTWQLEATSIIRSLRPVDERLTEWMNGLGAAASRPARPYMSIEEAVERLRKRHPRLSEAQLLHLTAHGIQKGLDGAFRWKHDRRVMARAPNRFSPAEIIHLWSQISAPVLLLSGTESTLSTPENLEVVQHFQNARSIGVEGTGHWPHHERPEHRIRLIREFLNDGVGLDDIWTGSAIT